MGKAREQYIIDEDGRTTALVLSLGRYRRLLEDLDGLSVMAERRDEPTVSLEELKRRLRADGHLRD